MFGGLMPALVTPFDNRGEVDLDATEAVIERFIEAGVSGISSGLTSETRWVGRSRSACSAISARQQTWIIQDPG